MLLGFILKFTLYINTVHEFEILYSKAANFRGKV